MQVHTAIILIIIFVFLGSRFMPQETRSDRQARCGICCRQLLTVMTTRPRLSGGTYLTIRSLGALKFAISVFEHTGASFSQLFHQKGTLRIRHAASWLKAGRISMYARHLQPATTMGIIAIEQPLCLPMISTGKEYHELKQPDSPCLMPLETVRVVVSASAVPPLMFGELYQCYS